MTSAFFKGNVDGEKKFSLYRTKSKHLDFQVLFGASLNSWSNCWDIVLNWSNFREQNNPHSSPHPLLSMLGWLLFCTGSRNVEGVGWEKLCFPLFKLAKYREALWCKVFQLNLSQIVDQYKLIPCILHQKINFFIVSSFPAAAHICILLHALLCNFLLQKGTENFSYPYWWLLLHNCKFRKRRVVS